MQAWVQFGVPMEEMGPIFEMLVSNVQVINVSTCIYPHEDQRFEFVLCSDHLLGYNCLLYANRLLGYNPQIYSQHLKSGLSGFI